MALVVERGSGGVWKEQGLHMYFWKLPLGLARPSRIPPPFGKRSSVRAYYHWLYAALTVSSGSGELWLSGCCSIFKFFNTYSGPLCDYCTMLHLPNKQIWFAKFTQLHFTSHFSKSDLQHPPPLRVKLIFRDTKLLFSLCCLHILPVVYSECTV